jgi:hypothetical protein
MHEKALPLAAFAAAALVLALAPTSRARTPVPGSTAAQGSASVSIKDTGAPDPVGTIEGTVRDSDEDAVAEARVTIFNEKTGEVWRPNCDPSGTFTVRGLQPGSYTIKVAATGLRTLGHTGIPLQARQAVHLDVTLGDDEWGKGDDSGDDDSEEIDDDKPSRKKSKGKGHFILRPFKAIGKIIPGVD